MNGQQSAASVSSLPTGVRSNGLPAEAIQVKYGHFIKRVIAFVVDELVIVPFLAIAYVMIDQGTTGWITFGLSIGAYGMSIGFFNRCIRMGVTGQSWGKMLTGTKLISERTGKPLGVGNTIVREMCHSADFIIVIGSLFPLFDRRRQSLGDKIAGSVVIDVKAGARQHEVSTLQGLAQTENEALV